MPGRGRAPKDQATRVNHVAPARGEWQPPPGVGWQHGEFPLPPARLLKASVEAWDVWMSAWFAGYWTEDDLPALRHVIRLYDQVERGQFQRASELRIQMDNYGITPKGQQDRRWLRPVESGAKAKPKKASRYTHLRAVDAG